MQAVASPDAQYAAALTHTLTEGLPTPWQPYPAGQSAPVVQAAVQYFGPVRHPKLHAEGSVHARPTSSAMQYFPPRSMQRVPDMQSASLPQGRVQRLGPPTAIGWHASPDAHSAATEQTSRSCPLPPPLAAEDAPTPAVAAPGPTAAVPIVWP